MTDNLVVVQSDGALTALELDDFSLAWRKELGDANLDAVLTADQTRILLAERVAGDDAAQALRFVWHDVETGHRRVAVDFPEVKFENLYLGPLMSVDERIWTLLGSGSIADKQLVEFAPASSE